MRSFPFIAAVWTLMTAVSSIPTPPPAQSECTEETMSVRKEWSALSKSERLDYIDSVKCLHSKPSKIPNGLAPGAKSLYDDFIATHINKTLHIHSDGLFLTWHRMYIHLFETALREECGFSGTLPYWNWPLWADDLAASPLFDGSETSLSGNGEHNSSALIPRPGAGTPAEITLPGGDGGGCVTTGPFANLTLHFQNFAQDAQFKFAQAARNPPTFLPSDALDYRPHCFRRNLNNYIASTSCNQSSVDYLIYQSPNISNFQSFLDGEYDRDPNIGAHPGGHYALGPDLWDLFTSPSDPAFWLHHGMIDLVYTMWQARGNATGDRYAAVSGTHTTLNTPQSANVTLDSSQDFGYLAQRQWSIRELMSATAGPFCYRYDY